MEKETNEKTAQRGLHGGVKALVIVGIVLIALVGLPLLYLTCIGFAYDDTAALLAAEPMPLTERYAFHAEAESVSIAVDKSDLYWAAAQEGYLDADGEVGRALADYGLTLQKTGVEISQDGVYLAAKLVYKGFLPVQAQARLSLSCSGRDVTARVEELRLGKWIALSPAQLPVDASLFTFTLDGGELHSRLEALQSIACEEGRLVLTCGVSREIVSEALENFGQVEEYAHYLGAFEAVAVARAYRDGDAGKVTDFLRLCEKDPAHFLNFKISELAIAEDHKANQYLTNSDARYLPRFFPGLTRDAVQALSTEYDDAYALHRGQLQRMARLLQTMYEAMEITTDGAQFFTNDGTMTPLTAALLAERAGEEEKVATDWLDAGAARILYAHGASYYMTQNVPHIAKMPQSTRTAFRGLQTGDPYVPVLLVKMADGACRLAFFETGSKFRLEPVAEAQYNEWMGWATIPVVELGLNG